MNVRPVLEEDIEQVIELFRLNYGDDYAIPEFYDPQWVKRGVYSDHIIWLVVEDEDRIVASGAVMLDFGDYNDQIGELGRVVVDPSASGKGLGRTLIDALIDASDERVEFAFAEARTVHPKTQKINDRLGLVPLGFLPMYYQMHWRESVVVEGQLYGNGRALRRSGQAEIIAPVAPLAQLSLHNLALEEPVAVRENVRGYPTDQSLKLEPLTGTSLVRLLKIEHGRVVEPEVFGGLHIDQGLSQLTARKATYLVAGDGAHTLGAVGYLYDERNKSVRIVELIARDESVKGSLLRAAVDQAEQMHDAEMLKCEVSAYSPRVQQTLFELGFLPVAYVPGMIFHETARWDVVKMMKLNVAWNLGPLELTEGSQAYYDLVVPAFERAAAQRERRLLALGADVLAGLSPLEVEFVQKAGQELAPPEGAELVGDSLNILLAGTVTSGGRTLERGACFGAAALLGGAPERAVANAETRLLRLDTRGLAELSERYPRLGLRLYRNLAACALPARAGEAAQA